MRANAKKTRRRRTIEKVLIGVGALCVLSAPLLVLSPVRAALIEPVETFFSPSVRVTFVGDMMFDRSVRQAMERKGEDHVFECVGPLLESADIVVGNLEGPITSNPSRSVGSEVGSPDNFVFTFPLLVAPLLERHNVRIVSLGNNHGTDFGLEGVQETIAALTEAGVGYFGEAKGQSVFDSDEGGVPLTYIGYNEFHPSSTAAKTIALIKEARARERLPIVFAHWGNEYEEAAPRQKKLARQFVDAGAELVIGAHPHVIQESEVYAGKHIYYSLGNFIFDQYWMESVRTGLMVTAEITPDGVQTVEEVRVSLERDRRTCPIL